MHIAQGNVGLTDNLEIGESLIMTPQKKDDPTEWRHQAANNPPISRPHDNEQWMMNYEQNELWTIPCVLFTVPNSSIPKGSFQNHPILPKTKLQIVLAFEKNTMHVQSPVFFTLHPNYISI